MQKLVRTTFALCAVGLLLPVGAAHALGILTGNDAISSYFDPNLTQPDLQLGGAGSTENSGGVAVFSDTAFTMELDFLNNSPPDYYGNIILTTALDSSVDYTGVSVSVSLDGITTGTLDFDTGHFTDAALFGLPFPPDGITGIGNGAGEFLSLNGALVGGFDLMTSLERGVNDPIAILVSVSGVTSSDQIVRFDAFGTNELGEVIIGNNPNSGAAGFLVPEPDAVVLFAVATLIAGATLRKPGSQSQVG